MANRRVGRRRMLAMPPRLARVVVVSGEAAQRLVRERPQARKFAAAGWDRAWKRFGTDRYAGQSRDLMSAVLVGGDLEGMG